MAGPAERHNVNLSHQVWGELKLRSFQERMSASELVAYIVEQATRAEPAALNISRYQPRNPDEDRLGRTVFFPPDVWQRAQTLAAKSHTSIAGLLDYLLRQYLGLLPGESTESETQAEPALQAEPEKSITYPTPPRGKTLRVGEEQVYLGENPIRIDLKTGKPIPPEEE